MDSATATFSFATDTLLSLEATFDGGSLDILIERNLNKRVKFQAAAASLA